MLYLENLIGGDLWGRHRISFRLADGELRSCSMERSLQDKSQSFLLLSALVNFSLQGEEFGTNLGRVVPDQHRTFIITTLQKLMQNV